MFENTIITEVFVPKLYYALYLAEGEDYISVSDSFTFNNVSARGFCLNVSIIDDPLVELSAEDFFVCASTDQLQALDIQFIPTCAAVNIADNDGTKKIE